MSFSFSACGKRDVAIGQLRAATFLDEPGLGHTARELAIAALQGVSGEDHGYDRNFVVRGSGHADAMWLTLSLSIETVNALKAVDVDQAAAVDVEEPMAATG